MPGEMKLPAGAPHPEPASEIGDDDSADLQSSEETDYPVIQAYSTNSERGIVRWWCIACRTWHQHGAVFGREHRISHCHDPRSEMYHRSYYVEPQEASEAILKAIERGRAPKPEGGA